MTRRSWRVFCGNIGYMAKGYQKEIFNGLRPTRMIYAGEPIPRAINFGMRGLEKVTDFLERKLVTEPVRRVFGKRGK